MEDDDECLIYYSKERNEYGLYDRKVPETYPLISSALGVGRNFRIDSEKATSPMRNQPTNKSARKRRY